MNKALFKSGRSDWETPQELFDSLDEEFHFDCDVCATEDNAKCDYYYSPADDGLKYTWFGVCWMNPPYGRQIQKWIKKASESDAVVVALLPARTDTKWFHDFIYNRAEIRFLKGRIRFVRAEASAPFPSMVVIFN